MSEADVDEAGYRRRDQRGDPDVAHELGNLLARRGDLDRAEEAYRRAERVADERDPLHAQHREPVSDVAGVTSIDPLVGASE